MVRNLANYSKMLGEGFLTAARKHPIESSRPKLGDSPRSG